MFRILMVGSALLFLSPQAEKKIDGPSDKVPDLKVLDHYVGTWNVEFVNKDLPFSKATATAKWILDGRFVEQTGELEPKEGASAFKIKTLYTFDANKNAFRSWTFTSDGSVVENDCVWDEKAKTMTSISKKVEGEGFSTTTADFSEAGVERWKIAITDATGKVTAEIVGKNTREKKK
jgi:hypothetical protein